MRDSGSKIVSTIRKEADCKDDFMNPMQTAAPIAAIRAREETFAERERLFTDPYAALFADGSPEVMELFFRIPFFEEQVRLRTRHIDDSVRRALDAGIRDVILVGAGFDCRGLRMPEIASTGARVIEVDHADQLAEKRRRLAAANVSIPPHVVHAPADLSIPGELERALRAAQAPARVNALWVCEGLLGYLDRDQIRALAEAAALLSAPGARLVANYSRTAWSSDTLDQVFAAAGWRSIETPSFDALYRTHIGPEPPPGSEPFALLEAEYADV